MYIWRLARLDETGFDEQIAVVVIAHTEDGARQVAAESKGDEGRWPWLTPNLTSCVAIGEALAEFDQIPAMVVRDFNAG